MQSSASLRALRVSIPKFELLEELGHGGMATVYRAHDPRLRRDVAIKVIHPHLRNSAEVTRRFAVEARAVAKLRHPNIVEVYDVSTEDEEYQYLVVELVRGQTLRKLLERHRVLPAECAAALVVELLNALAHSHGLGVVHRDVKPENVMIEHTPPSPGVRESSGGRVSVKLTDFGIAKLLDGQGVTSTGQVLGSPAHMAPEQIEGAEVDARSDLFALGVLFYECLVGQLPFRGNNPAQVLRRVLDGEFTQVEVASPTVGSVWSRIVARALAHAPEDRFQNASSMRMAVLDELRRLAIVSPRTELEAWCDAPEDYVETHRQRMVDRLCVCAAEARQLHKPLVAASDYNRALAYAPNDSGLLRIVATLHRRRALFRVALRALEVGGIVALVSIAAWGTQRVFRRPIAPDPTSIRATSSVSALPVPVSAPTARVSVEAPVTSVPISIPPLPRVAPTRRRVELQVRPSEGVQVAVDGTLVVTSSGGTAVMVLRDTRTHRVRLTCVQDLCEPQERILPAGEADVGMEITLAVKPATLVVEGDGTSMYQVIEKPTLAVRVGIPVSIPMHDKSTEIVHVRQVPSGRVLDVTLRAGKSVSLVFRD